MLSYNKLETLRSTIMDLDKEEILEDLEDDLEEDNVKTRYYEIISNDDDHIDLIGFYSDKELITLALDCDESLVTETFLDNHSLEEVEQLFELEAADANAISIGDYFLTEDAIDTLKKQYNVSIIEVSEDDYIEAKEKESELEDIS